MRSQFLRRFRGAGYLVKFGAPLLLLLTLVMLFSATGTPTQSGAGGGGGFSGFVRFIVVTLLYSTVSMGLAMGMVFVWAIIASRFTGASVMRCMIGGNTVLLVGALWLIPFSRRLISGGIDGLFFMIHPNGPLMPLYSMLLIVLVLMSYKFLPTLLFRMR
ncbi:hypothetical protein [Halovenus sp. HT40]|uniref:hypothetical protein n=1 Tax=Halovenus sp. HT40 TaxID=3126691 RepID=UPI00300F0701